ncbi:glutamate receptor 2.9 [Quercus suber]|uniref:Glutamate receptor n=1 Tax=Quercus suber TaxID=58331 RepID=A0AAW0LYT7_QUESU
MANQKHLFSFLSFLLLTLSLSFCLWGHEPLVLAKEVIPVGVVLDLKSPVGRVAESYMSMARSDFYAVNHNYRTRLTLFARDSGDDVITAASTALDLMKNIEVQAIIGPQSSAQARFVTELGRKAQVPIISFSATSPSLSPSQNQFFVRTTHDDSAQVKAIVDIVKAFGWWEIVLIYEDTDYGNGLIPYMLDALQEIDTRVSYRSEIHPSSNNTEISEELNKLKANHTRIFLVHMTASLGSKLFALAKNAGMMSEGYAWILTEGLSSLLDPMSSKVMDSMQGVLGIRPYLPPSKQLEDFERKWKRNLTSIRTKSKSITGLNFFGLWAYDTIWALAMAVEKASMGQLEPSTFELFNVIGKTERIIGYWTRQRGFSKYLNGTSERAYSTSKDKLKQPIWPGDTTEQPSKLRIGVPVTSMSKKFVKMEWHSPTDDKPSISGFCIDLFYAVYDAVVGDTTIVAKCSLYVDFTLPYTESGVSMVVLVKDDENKNLWIFLKPLSINLWLTIGASFIFTDFHESQLKPYSTFEGYHEALSKGTHNGGVAAIFDEIPYIKLFLAKYCSRYTMVGPTYKTDGFGFAFQQGSPLVPHISRAILNVTQDRDKIGAIEQKYFGSQTSCEDQSATISSHGPSLGVDNFRGLFLIAGITSVVSLLVNVSNFFYSHWSNLGNNNPANSYWSKLVEMAKHFDKKDPHSFQKEESRVHVVASPNVYEPSPSIDYMQIHSRNSIEGTYDVVIHDDNKSLSSSSRHGDASMQDVPHSS